MVREFFSNLNHETIINCLDLPLGHDLCLLRSVDFPHFLSKSDLLNFAVGGTEDASSLRENFHNTSDQFWATLSGDGAFTNWHRDKGGCWTWTCLSKGRKLFWWRNGEMVRCIIVDAGDLIILPPGLDHAVLSIGNCFGLGGHFYTWEALSDSLHHARLCEKNRRLTNDEPGMTKEYFRRFLKVLYHLNTLILGNSDTHSQAYGNICNRWSREIYPSLF